MKDKDKNLFLNIAPVSSETPKGKDEASTATAKAPEPVVNTKPVIILEGLATASEVLAAVSAEGKLDDHDTVLGTGVSYFNSALPTEFTEMVQRSKDVAGKVTDLTGRVAALPSKTEEAQANYLAAATPMLETLKGELTETWRENVAQRAERINQISELREEKSEVEGALATHVIRLTGSPDTPLPNKPKGGWAIGLVVVVSVIAVDWVLGTDIFSIASNKDIAGILSLVGAGVAGLLGVLVGQYWSNYRSAQAARDYFDEEYGDYGYSYTAATRGDKLSKMKEMPDDYVTSVYPTDSRVKANLRFFGIGYLSLLAFILVMRVYIIHAYLEDDWSQLFSTGIFFAATFAGLGLKYLTSSPYTDAALSRWAKLIARRDEIQAELDELEQAADPYTEAAKAKVREYSQKLSEVADTTTKDFNELSEQRKDLLAEVSTLQKYRHTAGEQLREFILEIVNAWQNQTGRKWVPPPSESRVNQTFDEISTWARLDGQEAEILRISIPRPKLTPPAFNQAEFEKELATKFPLPVAIKTASATPLKVVPPVRALAK